MAARRALSVIAAAVLSMAPAGCSTPAASTSGIATAKPTPSATSVSAPSDGRCTAALALAEVKAKLAGQEFEAHYLTISDELTLSIWLVDPEIDPAAPASAIPATGRMARAHGVSLAHRAVSEVPCVRRVFDQVNPMIVDRRYQHWYKDFLPVRALADLRATTADDLVAAIEATGTALEAPRTTAPEATASPAAGSCTWPEARAAVHDYFAGEDNTAAYLIIGAGLVARGQATDSGEDVAVEVQWPVLTAAEASDTRIRERLGYVARRLACMSPAVDSLEAFIVDESGRTEVYAVATAPVIRGGSVPLPAGGVHIYRMPAPPTP